MAYWDEENGEWTSGTAPVTPSNSNLPQSRYQRSQTLNQLGQSGFGRTGLGSRIINELSGGPNEYGLGTIRTDTPENLSVDVYGEQAGLAGFTQDQLNQQLQEGLTGWSEAGAQYDQRLDEVFGGQMARGETAGQRMLELSGTPLNPDLYSDPSYQFRRDEGLSGLQSMMGSSGMRQSGAALRGGTRYASDLASQEYGNMFSRAAKERQLQLTGLGQLGQLGSAAASQYGQQMFDPTQVAQTGLGTQLGITGGYGQTMQQSLQDLGANYAQIQANEQAASAARSAGSSSAAGSILAAGIGLFSDPRLKTGIKQIGTLKSGLGLYEYSYLWSDKRTTGVLSTEVREIMPEAVTTVHGFDAVNYSIVLAGE